MDKLKLIKQLKLDEGVRYQVYKDSLGYLTVGVGHLVLKKDNLKLGDTITEYQCDSFLVNDLNETFVSCYRMFPMFDDLPENVKQVIANMMFNLGYGNLSQFKRFIKGIKIADYELAAKSMEQSLWYTQVKGRAKRLVQEIRNTI